MVLPSCVVRQVLSHNRRQQTYPPLCLKEQPLSSTAVTGMIKLALQAGKANPAPPVGPALGAKVSPVPTLSHHGCCICA